MFNRTIMYAKLAWVYAKGICGFRRKVYDLKFVTLTVLGHYPQYIYIKQMPININND